MRFPRPVGRRRVYLCDVPDLDIFPARYGAHTVSFRTGFELGLFNHGLAVLGRLRRWGWMKNPAKWAPLFITVARVFHGFGGEPGGMQVQLRGRKNGRDIEHTAALLARDANGPAIECSPAIALIRKWVEHGIPATGARACVGWLAWNEIKAELVNYDITLVRS